MQWLNEPPFWRTDGGAITVQAAGGWASWFRLRGHVVPVPHIYCEDITGDFRAQVKVIPEFKAEWDEVGLYVQLNLMSFVKVGIEAHEEAHRLKWVVGRRGGRWSDNTLVAESPSNWLRIVREGSTFELSVSTDGVAYTVLHQALVKRYRTAKVGILVTSPVGSGFTSRFEELDIRQQGARIAK